MSNLLEMLLSLLNSLLVGISLPKKKWELFFLIVKEKECAVPQFRKVTLLFKLIRRADGAGIPNVMTRMISIVLIRTMMCK